MSSMSFASDLISRGFNSVLPIFGFHSLRPEQEIALCAFLSGKDVFVNLPTGFGKSIIFQMAPLLASHLVESSPDSGLGTQNAVLLVISPLISLMKDQVQYLRGKNIKATYLGEDLNAKACEDIVQAKYSIVYASPESILSNQRWRKMLLSEEYKSRLIGVAVDEAHCISQWGSTNSQSSVAFRKWFHNLSELRSLTKKPIMALTATATKSTRSKIWEILRFDESCVDVSHSPNKPNITYVVQKIDRRNLPIDYFSWLIEELKEKGRGTDRVIIYCQTIRQCQQMYSKLVNIIGDALFTKISHNPRNVLVEMLHSCTDEENKIVILESFSEPEGDIRVLVATIAFGMGVNCKGVHTTVHLGPSKNLEAYVQESGRAGRDGAPSKAIILYHGLMLVHVEQDIKDYVTSTTCRRTMLMNPFGINLEQKDGEPHHSCCDVCAKSCVCIGETCEIKDTLEFPVKEVKESNISTKQRTVSEEQRNVLKRKLVVARKQLVLRFLSREPRGKVSLFLHPEFVLGFAEDQIKQVVDNCEYLFTVNDIENYVEIWNSAHCKEILQVLDSVFGDIEMEYNSGVSDSDNESEDDESDNEWLQLVDKSAFLDIDEFELSGIDELNSFNDSEMDTSGNVAILPSLPDTVYDRMSFD